MTHVPPEVGQAITRQKARYARYSDLKQWDKFAQEIALPDARYSFLDTDGNPLILGKQALVFDSAQSCATFYSNSFAQMDTHHAVGPGDFEQVAPDQGCRSFEDKNWSGETYEKDVVQAFENTGLQSVTGLCKHVVTIG
ncbi:bile acid 7-alpha [Fusarium albosuccineum]|uniref:Bile acid 7-alpha n=1 Tax=Fusarium albosuccineum TaxID=1237068 RepID=A0A8H4KVF8_9HYPO|nr:bile acid 7-alpha [Fusarium albosuccineum]